MAEAKYDLLLVPTKTEKKIYEQPWYKERLRTHYVKSLGPKGTSKFLNVNVRQWTFIKDGLDDFRDGLPPLVEGGDVLKGIKGLKPNINESSDNISLVKQPAAPKRFTKEQICYSRVTPQQQDRRDHIDDVEYGLKQHPLALYPHLEESMPADLFEEVVEVLDPEMNLVSDEDEDSYDEGILEAGEQESQQDTASQANKFQEELPDEGNNTMLMGPEARQKLNILTTAIKLPLIFRRYLAKRDGEQKPVKNPYRWLPKKEEKEKKDKKKGDRRSPSPTQDEHIKEVAKDFCNWVSSLGGETNNIEESTIMSLFASGYETKPALSVPIHVVELTNVPAELRISSATPSTAQPDIPQPAKYNDDWTYSGSYKPSWVKFRYGAWYLPPNTWQKMKADEPLQDPRDLRDQEQSEALARSNNLDHELAPMHGTKSFMEFVDKKNTRRPEFLNHVRNIQEVTAKEEATKQAAERQSKKKSGNKRHRQLRSAVSSS